MSRCCASCSIHRKITLTRIGYMNGSVLSVVSRWGLCCASYFKSGPTSRQPFQAKDLQGLRPVLYRHGGKQVHAYMLAHLYEGGAVEQDIVVRGVCLQASGDIHHVADSGVVLHTS